MRYCKVIESISRAMALALAFCLLLAMVPCAGAQEYSGACGDSLSWELTEDTLVISGTGDMWDFPESTMAPWYEYREEITRVVFPEGLTSIGDLAFYGCGELTVVSVPDSVLRIGQYAFALCEKVILLDLGNGVETIERAAFRECYALSAVRLPDSLKTLEFQAFYRCESLSSVIVPASVTEMGMTVFGYCFGLVRAEILANIQVLPDWTFYGCEALTDVYLTSSLTGCRDYAFYDCLSLNNVEYNGSAAYANKIRQDIQEDLERSGNSGSVGTNQNDTTSIHTKFEEQDGDLVSTTTVTQQTSQATLTTKETVTYPSEDPSNGSGSVCVDVTLESPEGWNEISDVIAEAAEQQDPVDVNVYLKDGNSLPEGALANLAEKNVTVSVSTSSGAYWEVDCSQIVVGEADASIDLSYERQPATQAQKDALGGADSYQVNFSSTVEAEAEVMIRLPVNHAGGNAFLYQMKGNTPELLQASRVDSEGYAHFYLASVDEDTQYLIGINVPGENTENVIIPKTEEKKYDITDTMAPIDYVITGRTSSWNMNIGQVTWIMIGVLIGSVAIIGVVLFMLNKRKLKKGYVVDLDEYEIN